VTTRRPLFQFAETHGLQLPHLTEAEEATRRAIDELTPLVEDGTTDDVALVVFGSLARREMTSESDVDWTLLIDGPVDPAHFDSALRLEEELENTRFRRHGREGTFGGFAISHDLVHKIGGGDDSNRNTTQRILLLVESCSIGRDAAYRRVFRSVLHRYITDDWGWVHGRGPAKVPRFLQNDLARYWRTVAVDFAYKRRDRGGKGWALRTVKLRVSRKMTYAAGLLACFSCDLENVLNGAGTDEAPEQVIITHLVDLFTLPPLDILTRVAARREALAPPTARLLHAYDAFLGLLSDPEKRDRLRELKPAESNDDPLYQEAREIGHRFQAGLDAIFFDDDEIARLTKIYGVF